MKKILALALAASFATIAFADEKKKPAAEPSCKMECCKKNGKTCKDCPDCAKKAEKKTEKKG
jgi:hypothetical protein